MKKKETPIRDPKSIFSCDWCLTDIITRLQKYLKTRLYNENGQYYCFYKEGGYDFEYDWHFTKKFCDKMKIGIEFIQMLNEFLDYPNHEADFLDEFSIEDVIKKVHQNREMTLK